jgi:hypothetical protein
MGVLAVEIRIWSSPALATRERSTLWVCRVRVLTRGGEMVWLVWKLGATSSARPVRSPGP